ATDLAGDALDAESNPEQGCIDTGFAAGPDLGEALREHTRLAWLIDAHDGTWLIVVKPMQIVSIVDDDHRVSRAFAFGPRAVDRHPVTEHAQKLLHARAGAFEIARVVHDDVQAPCGGSA